MPAKGTVPAPNGVITARRGGCTRRVGKEATPRSVRISNIRFLVCVYGQGSDLKSRPENCELYVVREGEKASHWTTLAKGARMRRLG